MKPWKNPLKLAPVAWRVAVAFLALGALGGCGTKQDETTTKAEVPEVEADFSPTIARVGDVKITQAYFDYRYDNLSPQEKARYTGDGWQGRFLKSLVDETLVYEQAKKEGFQNQREVQWRLDMASRSILHKAFYDYYFKDHLEIPEDQIQDYYEKNKENYQSLGRALAYHIQCSSKDRIDAAAAELAAGKHFESVALKYSEDEATKNDGGLLGWFNPDGYVLGMGFNKEFTDFVFAMEGKGTSDPVKIGDSWHIIKLSARVDGEQQTLEQVRDRVERELRPLVAEEAFERRLRELKQSLGVQFYGDYDVEETRSAEQLYRLAGESRDPRARLNYYESLVENYPEHELADDALFMKGFIHSEQYGEVGLASKAFRRLEEEYPESQWIESAQWLLKHAARSEPELLGDQLPGDAAEAGDRIESVRQ